MKSSVGFGIDGLKLAGESADYGSELIDFSRCGVAASGIAEIAASLFDAVFEGLGGAVGLSENREGLAALGLSEIEAASEVMDTAFGEGFVVVMPTSTGLSAEEEDEAEEINQGAHSSYLSS